MSQAGNPSYPVEHIEHLSPETLSLQEHFPLWLHVLSTDPSSLHPQAEIVNDIFCNVRNIYFIFSYWKCIHSQVGNPKCSVLQTSHLSPPTPSLQVHFPSGVEHFESIEPSTLHSHAKKIDHGIWIYSGAYIYRHSNDTYLCRDLENQNIHLGTYYKFHQWLIHCMDIGQ